MNSLSHGQKLLWFIGHSSPALYLSTSSISLLPTTLMMGELKSLTPLNTVVGDAQAGGHTSMAYVDPHTATSPSLAKTAPLESLSIEEILLEAEGFKAASEAFLKELCRDFGEPVGEELHCNSNPSANPVYEEDIAIYDQASSSSASVGAADATSLTTTHDDGEGITAMPSTRASYARAASVAFTSDDAITYGISDEEDAARFYARTWADAFFHYYVSMAAIPLARARGLTAPAAEWERLPLTERTSYFPLNMHLVTRISAEQEFYPLASALHDLYFATPFIIRQTYTQPEAHSFCAASWRQIMSIQDRPLFDNLELITEDGGARQRLLAQFEQVVGSCILSPTSRLEEPEPTSEEMNAWMKFIWSVRAPYLR